MPLLNNGDLYTVGKIPNNTATLPVGTYRIVETDHGVFLRKIEDFSLPRKIYGIPSNLNIVLDEFMNTDKNTGITLEGEKGSGKTLVAKYLARKTNRPIIVIDKHFDANMKNLLVSHELYNSVVFIDEYDKIFRSEEEQNSLLDILDGVYKTKYLFIMTSNSPSHNPYLNNRLSRIKFKIQYKSLNRASFDEVCNDLLENKTYKDKLYDFFCKLGYLNFDTLIETIKLLNTHKTYSVDEVLSILNVSEINRQRRLYQLYLRDTMIFSVEGFYNHGRWADALRYNNNKIYNLLVDLEEDPPSDEEDAKFFRRKYKRELSKFPFLDPVKNKDLEITLNINDYVVNTEGDVTVYKCKNTNCPISIREEVNYSF